MELCIMMNALSDLTKLQVKDDTEDPWLAFLPFISKEMAILIFRCFLKRSTSILSTVSYLAPSFPPLQISEFSQYPAQKLLNASSALLKMYKNAGDEVQKNAYLGLVATEKEFIYYVLQLTCKLLHPDNIQTGDSTAQHFALSMWQGSATGLIGIITWALESCDDRLKDELEKQGLLVKILDHFKQIPLEIVQKFSQESINTHIIYLCIRVLFQCAVHSNSARSLYQQHNCTDILCDFLLIPDVEVQLITKALLLCLSSEVRQSKDGELAHQVLREDEITVLIKMLIFSGNHTPTSFHMLSFVLLFKMMKSLLKVAKNAALFIQWGIPDLLAELSDKLTDDEQLEQLAELVWDLMQFKNGDDLNVTTIAEFDSNQLEHSVAAICHDPPPNEILKTISSAEATVTFTELLLRYLIKTLLPYEGTPLDDGFEQLSEATWFTISECILLISLIQGESDSSVQGEIVRTAIHLPQTCKAIQLAFHIGLGIKDGDGLPNLVMKHALSAVRSILMTWSDLSSKLAQEMARSGFVQMSTFDLHAGLCLNSINQESQSILLSSLIILLNIAYDPLNYPAFFFADTIREIVPYVHVDDFDLSSTARFILSCLHRHLDCEQLISLKIKEKEANYCVKSLQNAIVSPDFKADGFAVHELLQILTNLTHPSHSAVIKMISTKSHSKKEKTSYFDQKMLEAAETSEHNCFILNQFKIIPLLDDYIFKEMVFQHQACKLLWNFLHQDGFKDEITSNHSGICESVHHIMQNITSTPDDQLLCHCCLWLLGEPEEKDLEGKLTYAEGCYKFENFTEAVTACSEIIASIAKNALGEALPCQANLLKGKALFYSYQRKLVYLMEKKSLMDKEEEKRLVNECFESIKEVISLLGTALDEIYIDQEGSKLLDWSMMDCIRETNQLNLCKRCLLCRQRGTLCKSHIFPRFQLSRMEEKMNSSKSFIFGLDKHQMKSAGECWLWLCCKRCEGIMTQNAENEFSQLFPPSGQVEYTSWLFNYCCTILFRTLSCVKFPRAFNDEEVYEAFLSCRKHLLSLPVKANAPSKEITTKAEDYQLELLSQVITKEIVPFLFVIPTNLIFQNRDDGEQQHLMFSIPWLAPHRLVDGRKDFAGNSHFFVAYCDRITILLQFSPSAQCLLPESCRISPLNGTYSIPEGMAAIELIPKGLWMLQRRSALKSVQDLTEVLQQLPPRAADKMVSKLKGGQPSKSSEVQASESTDLQSSLPLEANSALELCSIQDDVPPIPFPMASNKPQLSMLPQDFKVVKPLPKTQIDKLIKLPQGHQIKLHHIEDSCSLTVFLAINNSGQPYVIYLHDSNQSMYVDGAFIAEIDKEICFLNYLADHSVYAAKRDQSMAIQEQARALVVPLLFKNGFFSLEMFLNFLNCRQSIRIAKDLLSLGIKCSPEGCWYCSDLCHCCMKPALLLNAKEIPNIKYRFCSKTCGRMFCIRPSLLPKSMYVIDHREEFVEGKFKGPSVLDIIQMSEEDGAYNKIDFLSLCIGDCSKDQELYILWQIRSVNHQSCMSFSITEECSPLQILWPHLMDEEKACTLLEAFSNLKPMLLNLFKDSFRSLGCENIDTYLRAFNFIVKP